MLGAEYSIPTPVVTEETVLREVKECGQGHTVFNVCGRQTYKMPPSGLSLLVFTPLNNPLSLSLGWA